MVSITPKAIQECSRFATEQGRTARLMNKLAIAQNKTRPTIYTFPNASAEDLKRLTSNSLKESYKRVTWINPKDNKVYHILEDGRKDGKIQVRILNQDGSFNKNAELTPKNVVVFDSFYGIRGMSHGEMMETFIRRNNPFVNIERLHHIKGIMEFFKYRKDLPIHLETKRFEELYKQMDKGKKVDYISISEIHGVDISKVCSKPGKEQVEYTAGSPYLCEIKPLFEKIIQKGTRILMAAGNSPEGVLAKEIANDHLAIQGIEGVGSLRRGKIAKDSCSRNSAFTQHYERRDYKAILTQDKDGEILGINITGLPGTDLPFNYRTKRLKQCGGTSYAVPIRVAKLALNDMLAGIL